MLKLKASEFEGWLKSGERRALVMGVLNVTPDSFSDGGRFSTVEAAIAQGKSLYEQDADILDIGGESTRPGALRIDSDEQIRRVIPVIEGLCRSKPGILISIDTTRAKVAKAALEAGATLINDISGGEEDDGMLELVRDKQCAIVLMHKQGTPESMQKNPVYWNVVEEVKGYLAARVELAMRMGIEKHRLLIDPGIGFGKRIEHNLLLIQRCRAFKEIGQALLMGVSRKSYIEKITGETEPDQRQWGTAASVAWCIANGSDIVRVHDAGAMSKVVRMVAAIQHGRLE